MFESRAVHFGSNRIASKDISVVSAGPRSWKMRQNCTSKQEMRSKWHKNGVVSEIISHFHYYLNASIS